MEAFGYLFLGGMGLVLGLMGAGGSIMTLPILIYLFQMPVVLATSYSLVIVGATALIGLLRNYQTIQFRKGMLFLIPSVLGVYGARHFLMPLLPDFFGVLTLDQSLVLLLLVFMGGASYTMIRTQPLIPHPPKGEMYVFQVIVLAGILGVVMGILGAGGGFLIIPTLVLLMGFSMDQAVPTSLLIITANAVIGIAGDHHSMMGEDWVQVGKYLGPAFLGMILGLYLGKYLSGPKLKIAFGYFVAVIGLVILLKEFIL